MACVPLTTEDHVAFTNQAKREMSKWCEVAACPNRSSRRDDGMDAVIQELRNGLNQ